MECPGLDCMRVCGHLHPTFARIPECVGSATLPVVDKYGSISVREQELTLLFPRGEGGKRETGGVKSHFCRFPKSLLNEILKIIKHLLPH